VVACKVETTPPWRPAPVLFSRPQPRGRGRRVLDLAGAGTRSSKRGSGSTSGLP